MTRDGLTLRVLRDRKREAMIVVKITILRRAEIAGIHRVEAIDTHKAAEIPDIHRTEAMDTRRAAEIPGTHRVETLDTHRVVGIPGTHRAEVQDTHKVETQGIHKMEVIHTPRTEIPDIITAEGITVIRPEEITDTPRTDITVTVIRIMKEMIFPGAGMTVMIRAEILQDPVTTISMGSGEVPGLKRKKEISFSTEIRTVPVEDTIPVIQEITVITIIRILIREIIQIPQIVGRDIIPEVIIRGITVLHPEALQVKTKILTTI